ncbi:recombination protein NinB [Vreelandella aquamarina]|uniref:recombination protein NinB n=1 Tax=Vreelandella aquamarina TaxID=77097 RepID=UPI003D05770E
MGRERVFRIHSGAGRRPAFLAAWNLVKEAFNEGGCELVVRKLKDKRSLEQNKRYWALLREVSACIWVEGRTFADVVWHEQFKRWFIGCNERVLPDGSTELSGISTTSLSVEDFGKYMMQIEAWAAEQGYPLMEYAA